jgi:hypothetical protein
MPLLSPSCQPSPAHGRVNRISAIGLSAIGVALGAWQAKSCASIAFGYVAGYAYATAVFLAMALCGIGLLLLIYWRTRGIGFGLLAAGLLSCVTFYGGMAVLLKLDRVAWQHEPPPVAIGHDQKATLVIYFRRGTTDEQIEEFHSWISSGTADPSEYLRLLPSQANGYEGVALTFSKDTPPEQVTRYVEKIKGDSRVEKIYRDIAPTAIPPQPNQPPTAKLSR